MSRSNRRYRDIKRQLQENAPQPAAAKHDDELGRVLDELNAWGFLEAQQQRRHEKVSCFGPGHFRGYLPITWAGVGVWYKQRGYYYYDRIQLVGIWALRSLPEQIEVVLGVRDLIYAMPFFNPESYYRRIQQEFRTFYKDSGAPPSAAQQRYSTNYDPTRRLEIRRALEDELIIWATELSRDW
jgi:hypothetical protein